MANVSEQIKREVALLRWDEYIGGEEETPGDRLLVRAGELSIENDELRSMCGRSVAQAEEWKRHCESAERRAAAWHKEALAWRWLAGAVLVVLIVAGAWRLLG